MNLEKIKEMADLKKELEKARKELREASSAGQPLLTEKTDEVYGIIEGYLVGGGFEIENKEASSFTATYLEETIFVKRYKSGEGNSQTELVQVQLGRQGNPINIAAYYRLPSSSGFSTGTQDEYELEKLKLRDEIDFVKYRAEAFKSSCIKISVQGNGKDKDFNDVESAIDYLFS